MTEPIILSRAYHPLDPTEIEKIVLEVLLNYDNLDPYFSTLAIQDFPNVAREVAERITNENR